MELVRLLDGTKLGPSSYATAHVLLIDGHSGALRCEGLVDGNWTRTVGARDLTPIRAFTSGIMKLALGGVCGASRGGACDPHYSTDGSDYNQVDYHDGNPDAPAPKSRARARH